jgi:LysR family hydrogen peroxide-inducible transcriptional activator
MEEYSNLQKGKLIIGAIPIIGHLGLTSLLASFTKSFPGIELKLYEAGSKDLLQALYSFEIDLAIGTPPLNEDTTLLLDIQPLIVDEIVLVTSKDNSLASRDTIQLPEVQNENFLFMKPHIGMRDICMQACLQAGFEPSIIFESSQTETICGLVSGGIGIALLTRKVAESYKGAIQIIRISPEMKRTTALITTKRKHYAKPLEAFRHFARSWYASNQIEQ